MAVGRASQQYLDKLEAKLGKIPLSGRYHKLPKKIEDEYDVEQVTLGSGYNGVVRQARSRFNKEQTFAVKAFKFQHVAKEKRAQLDAEVEIFLTLDHPHIARLYAVYECDEYLNLVMECLSGGELFDRITKMKKFTEITASDCAWQMLLAVNYLHLHGIVHRDLKLENFLYEAQGSDQLKLIDFGFSKVWDAKIKMHVSCGTLSYVAPEVIKKDYTSQCDLWSLGVIVFILLVGYMPFAGSEDEQTKNICAGNYKIRKDRWSKVSTTARSFVQDLLVVDAGKRMTAAQALEHEWLKTKNVKTSLSVDQSIVDALQTFGTASKFRRCVLEMLAWSLSSDERKKVQDIFLAMDTTRSGTITLCELRDVLVDKFSLPDSETQAIFSALDTNSDEEIHYSDFLAAMVSHRIELHDDLLYAAFRKFDADNSNYITVENLKEILGAQHKGVDVRELLKEADFLNDDRLSYPEFVAFMKQQPYDPKTATITPAVLALDSVMGQEDNRPLPDGRAPIHLRPDVSLSAPSRRAPPAGQLAGPAAKTSEPKAKKCNCALQ